MEVIKLVLASPSDLKQERQMIKDLIDDEINPLCKRHNLFVDLRRWEDTIPGINEKGAQGLIDLDLEIPQSDVFVCLYGRKIGTIIPDEGIAGTEHELNTALTSFRKYHKPEIKTYFLKADNDSSTDYDDIQKVAERIKPIGLYGTFSDVEDLKNQIRSMIMNTVMGKMEAQNSKGSGSITDLLAIKTAEDLIANIQPDKHLVLRTKMLDILNFEDGTPYVNKKRVFDGYEVVFSNVHDITIEAFSEDDPVVVTRPTHAAVLCLNNCENVVISKITFGHMPRKGECSGPVLRLNNCKNIYLNNVKLFGCGTYGIEAQDCENIVLSNTEIYECTLGAVFTHDTSFSITNCRIYDCNTKYISNLINVYGGQIALKEIFINNCSSSEYVISLSPDKKGNYPVFTGENVYIENCIYPAVCNLDINWVLSDPYERRRSENRWM